MTSVPEITVKTAAVVVCDTVATCMYSGKWSITTPNPGDLDCGGGPAIACPSSYATVPLGQPCTPIGGYCDYSDGRCACAMPVSGPAMRRPSLGSICTGFGLDCDYGKCNGVPGGNVETCGGGYWINTLSQCTH